MMVASKVEYLAVKMVVLRVEQMVHCLVAKLVMRKAEYLVD